jgi:hypothetical protein
MNEWRILKAAMELETAAILAIPVGRLLRAEAADCEQLVLVGNQLTSPPTCHIFLL